MPWQHHPGGCVPGKSRNAAGKDADRGVKQTLFNYRARDTHHSMINKKSPERDELQGFFEFERKLKSLDEVAEP